ncbi:MAG: hypothetical protein PWR23_1618 [Peptostreptococcaceae bacterium]|jgi:glycosyltransferase involved in cell wall biosynthesis|nr:hypothetical protein [Peptostreptococcaceae bacterium]
MYPLKDHTMVSEIPDEIEIIRIDEATNIDSNYANKLIQLYRGVINDDSLIESYIKELNKSQEHLNKLILLPDPYILWASEVLDQIDDKIDFEEISMIYSTSGPYSDHIIGYYLKQKHNKPWVADFRDEWTNNPYVKFNKQHISYKVNFAMEKNIVGFADRIIAVTPMSTDNYKDIFNIEKGKITTITNGYDELDFTDIINHKNKNRKFTIMHNGMLYMVRTPLTFMKAIHNLIQRGKIKKSNIKVVFGWTEDLQKWTEIRDELGLSDIIEFLDYMTHDNSLNEANKADALLLIVGAGEKNKSVYPGKIFEYLRLCKPILALSPKGSVVEKLVHDLNRGKNVEFDDIKQLEECILEMYRDWITRHLYKDELIYKERVYKNICTKTITKFHRGSNSLLLVKNRKLYLKSVEQKESTVRYLKVFYYLNVKDID